MSACLCLCASAPASLAARARAAQVHETGTEDFFNAAHGYVAVANFSQARRRSPAAAAPERAPDNRQPGRRLVAGRRIIHQDAG